MAALAALAASIAVLRPASAQSVGKFPDPGPGPPSVPTAPTAPTAPPGSPAPPADIWSRYPRIPAGPEAAPASPSVLPLGAFAPPVLPYREGAPIPQGYRLEESSREGLIVGGAGTVGGAYVIGLGLAIANDFDEGMGWLALPVFGPWAAIGAREVSCNTRTTNSECIDRALSEAERITFLTVDGLIQAAGLALIVVGVVSKHRELVRSDVARIELAPSVVLRPHSLGPGLGFGASGVF